MIEQGQEQTKKDKFNNEIQMQYNMYMSQLLSEIENKEVSATKQSLSQQLKVDCNLGLYFFSFKQGLPTHSDSKAE